MKSILGGLWLLWAAVQYQPTFPGCQGCGVIGYVDLPANTATVSNAALLAGWQAFEGWGTEKAYGELLDRVDIYVEDDTVSNTWHPVQEPNNLSTGYARPDVVLAFSGVYPRIGGQTGFVRWINNPLPLGAHRFQFVLWAGAYNNNMDPTAPPLIKTLNVVP